MPGHERRASQDHLAARHLHHRPVLLLRALLDEIPRSREVAERRSPHGCHRLRPRRGHGPGPSPQHRDLRRNEAVLVARLVYWCGHFSRDFPLWAADYYQCVLEEGEVWGARGLRDVLKRTCEAFSVFVYFLVYYCLHHIIIIIIRL